MEYVKVSGTSFVRDVNSMALVNQDQSGLQEYLNKRQAMARQKEEINTIKSEIESIKSDMSDIKSMMLQLLEKGSNG